MRRPRDPRPLGISDYRDTVRLMGFVPSPRRIGAYVHPEHPGELFAPRVVLGEPPLPLRERMQALKRQLDRARARRSA